MDLAAARVDLAAARVDLEVARVDPAVVRVDLAAARVDPAAARVDLAAARVNLAVIRVDLAVSRVDLAVSRVDLRPRQRDLQPRVRDLHARGDSNAAVKHWHRERRRSPGGRGQLVACIVMGQSNQTVVRRRWKRSTIVMVCAAVRAGRGGFLLGRPRLLVAIAKIILRGDARARVPIEPVAHYSSGFVDVASSVRGWSTQAWPERGRSSRPIPKPSTHGRAHDLSLYPVLKIHPTTARHTPKKPSVMPTLIVTSMSALP